MIGNWVVAGDAAQKMLEERMSSASSLTALEIPIFLDSGQSLLLQFAGDERLSDPTIPPEELQEILAQLLRSAPYFRQIFLLDDTGNSISGFPLDVYDDDYAPMEERMGIDLAKSGVLIQAYTIPPLDSDLSARVTFIAAIDDDGKYDLYVMSADGSSNHNVTPEYFPSEFLCNWAIFSRDDESIFFVGEWWQNE